MTLLDPAGLRDVLAALQQPRRLLLCTHARPDGDALGSELGLARLLESQGKSVDCFVDGGTPPDLAFLPGSARIGATPAAAKPPYDAAVVLDSAGIERVEHMRPAITPGLRVLNIDHHASNPRFGAVNWVEPEVASVGEMIYALAKQAGWPIDLDTATCLYVATYTDTGRFSFPSTRPSTHDMAADLLRVGVQPGDIHRQIYASRSLGELRLQSEMVRGLRTAEDGRVAWAAITPDMLAASGVNLTESQEYVSLIKSIRGVEIALLLRPLSAGEVKISVRSEAPADASRIAGAFGGGGHKRAAGATMRMSLAEAERRLVEEAVRELRGGK